MKLWSLWLIVSLLLGILELFLPGVALLCLCGGAAAAAGMAWFEFSFLYQLAVFSGVSLVLFVFIRPVLLSVFYPCENSNQTNVHALVDKIGCVIQEIPGGDQRGWINVDREDWPARSLDRNKILANTEVRVKKIEGNTLFVEGVS